EPMVKAPEFASNTPPEPPLAANVATEVLSGLTAVPTPVPDEAARFAAATSVTPAPVPLTMATDAPSVTVLPGELMSVPLEAGIVRLPPATTRLIVPLVVAADVTVRSPPA